MAGLLLLFTTLGECQARESALKIQQLPIGHRVARDLVNPDGSHRLDSGTMNPPPFLTRVRLSRYRSIRSCDVGLGSLAILVGPNGSGKSNFLDALGLVADALNSSLDHALRARGGLRRVLHQPARSSDELEIVLDFQLPYSDRPCPGRYRLALGTGSEDGGWQVTREECVLLGRDNSEPQAFFSVEKGIVTESSFEQPPAAVHDGLYLTRVSSIAELGAVADGLSRMRFFDLHLGGVPRLIEQEPGLVLAPDGRNLAAVVHRLQSDSPRTLERVTEYLRVVQPNLEKIEAVTIDDFVTVDFLLRVGTRRQHFPISSMSDGTLNALAVLITAFQPSAGLKAPPVLIGVEEPEKALHPAVSTLLTDAFLEASRSVQVMVTSHSPDLLEHEELEAGSLVAVEAEDGITRLGRLDEFAHSVLRDRLTTPGELHRQNQLRPEGAVLPPSGHSERAVVTP